MERIEVRKKQHRMENNKLRTENRGKGKGMAKQKGEGMTLI
jgi:hypothetical protein